MMATIRINDLRLRAFIGTHPWERRNKQDLILNLAICYDASKASKSDRLKDALDYEALTERVGRTVQRSRHYLLEKLAAKVLDVVLAADPRVSGAWVRLDKPHAIGEARSVSFELARALKK
ncbi:MAG: dihydroneopterin aldolase [Candidatus Omnitrophota bacterium]|nr:dihydroneopterin aldolase [Candidatus Omnitrophota bacterium]